jgi:aminopeptidase YwaD
MKIKTIVIAILLINSIVSVSQAKFQENNYESIRDRLLSGRTTVNLIQQLDEKLMNMYLENLTDIGQRTTGTPGCEKAAECSYNQLKSVNLSVRYHEWKDHALSGKNVEATLNGTDKSSDKIYIICGHYDGVPESVGADDNGAGTVSVISAAKILSQYKFDHTIKFVLFSGEEQGLYGSYHYAIHAAKNNDNIAAVLNIDMTGYAENIEDGNRVKVYDNIRSKWISQKTIEISKKYQNYINLDVELERIYSPISDHFGFWQNGYDAVFYYESNSNPNFHTPEDNMITVNITYATKIAKLTLATLIDLSEISNLITGEILYVGGTGPGNYSKITEAIQNSTNCDTIYVYNGDYNEKITINESIDLIGENNQKCNLTHNKTQSVISINSDYCYVTGLNIKNTCKTWCSPGVDLYSDHCAIIGNDISDNKGYGIGLKSALLNDISYNIIDNNTNGIMIWGVSPYNKIHHNKITDNELSGVTLSAKSYYTCLKYNLISNNLYGIYTQVGGKRETLGNPTYTNIYSNEISKNNYGIYLNIYSTKNKIISNNIKDNEVGVYLGLGCRSNKLLKNNFIENNIHATFESVIFNIWLRNYWDNRTINVGPKLIKGVLRNIPTRPQLIWYNIDLIPKKKPYKI